MTRINAGIDVIELCDQHLLAEYRELPRMVRFAGTLSEALDVDFCLNTGHMRSLARYGAYLADRHHRLVAEMRHRGFVPNLEPVRSEQFPAFSQYYPSVGWLVLARMTVGPRIVERLQGMSREPTWTKRFRPCWADAAPADVTYALHLALPLTTL